MAKLLHHSPEQNLARIKIDTLTMYHKVIHVSQVMLSGLHRNDCIIGSLLHSKLDQLKQSVQELPFIPPRLHPPFSKIQKNCMSFLWKSEYLHNKLKTFRNLLLNYHTVFVSSVHSLLLQHYNQVIHIELTLILILQCGT